jgi:hypothetical protein
MGLVKEGEDYAILTDIAGAEDHYGDMDFKVTGTAEALPRCRWTSRSGHYAADHARSAGTGQARPSLHPRQDERESITKPARTSAARTALLHRA